MPLDDAGAAGSTVTFTAKRLTTGLYLTNIAVKAGTGGIHITHPLFVTWMDTTASPDPVDSFDTIDMDLAQGMSAPIGSGLLLLENVPAGAELSVSFKKIGPSTGAGTGTLTGCKVVASFTTNAKPQLSTNCVSCHGGSNASASNALDMTMVNDTSTTGQTTACGQVLGRVNLTTPALSDVLVQPDPASGSAHPFHFATTAAYTTFNTALSTWITAEKAAP
jgi:hypothetical protein